jgi:hypothetical protein
LYYSLTGKDDQEGANEYSFTLTPEIQDRLAHMTHDPDLDRESIARFRSYLARSGMRLVLIQPPYHRAYMDNVPGFAAANAARNNTIAGTGVDYYDHSGLFIDRPELFADPIHLNRAGRHQYSTYLAGVVKTGNER